MPVLQKVESAFLKLLRMVFLLVATVAMGSSIALAGKFFITYFEKNEVAQKLPVALNLNGYKTSSDDLQKIEATLPNGEEDKLAETFYYVLDKNSKELNPALTPNKEAILQYVKEIENDPELGRNFLNQLVPLLDSAFKNPDIALRAKTDFLSEVKSLMFHFETSYKRQVQQNQIMENQVMKNRADKQAAASSAMYAAIILFGAFFGLFSLAILLKMERSLRTIAAATVRASAEQ
ncbi:hypothetical protein RGU70_12565 [Herbaspirillum sp. RTI4]|uniref:hypothetical protein n=1 Tax=Herbaspirillum sp. RTI4 TaxID=3048640 RepID=UPI002AB408F4|nr:hypothetical protein [Herbaspirillum sp. RTI4]MDY7579154.1 hypothetical protein [Herbaspirillum sp. RTI4]MEA9981267.1 hypothetical protein [Herbaspirillum sp. RTI4]